MYPHIHIHIYTHNTINTYMHAYMYNDRGPLPKALLDRPPQRLRRRNNYDGFECSPWGRTTVLMYCSSVCYCICFQHLTLPNNLKNRMPIFTLF